jgi:hypothetical protein
MRESTDAQTKLKGKYAQSIERRQAGKKPGAQSVIAGSCQSHSQAGGKIRCQGQTICCRSGRKVKSEVQSAKNKPGASRRARDAASFILSKDSALPCRLSYLWTLSASALLCVAYRHACGAFTPHPHCHGPRPRVAMA